MIKTLNEQILEIPIRGDIFSPERLNQYAVYLAQNLQISKEKNGVNLLSRVEQNYEVFLDIYKQLTNELKNGEEIPPAGIWLVDNHFIIEDQFREIRKDLPGNYYTELPKIKSGDLEGYPRIYAMALSLIAHLDSHLEMGPIESFVKSFQSITPLSSGEIWAFPITLRIALIENLRRLAIQIRHTHEIKTRSSKLAEEIAASKMSMEDIQKKLSSIICDSYMSDYICICHLSKQMREQTPDVLPVYEIINKYLAKKNLTIEETVHKDYLQQAITQMSVGNIVSSMRLLSSADWKMFFENVSLVEQILNTDPSGIYGRMDFVSRDTYRHSIERISKRTQTDEISIAQVVVDATKNAQAAEPHDKFKSHIGYHLIGEGVLEIEKQFAYAPGFLESLKRSFLHNPNTTYFGLFALLQMLFWFSIIYFFSFLDTGLLILFALISFIPVSDLSIDLLNFCITNFLPPRVLPKIELNEEIPENAKTFVVIPTIFNSKAAVDNLVERLEIHYLSNIDPHIYFGILSDFADCHEEKTSGDEDILKLADKKIAELNEKYAPDAPQFFYFHRARQWNESEKKWMGWERKRGKLEQFNCFLQNEESSPFLKTENQKYWDRKLFSEIKYVITLDSDTQMPRESAKKLIGTILHPMNAPLYNPDLKRVTRGYCILQPRMGITPTSAGRSFFSTIYSGHIGIDPYTTAVSDAYQDLYGEGIFVGKGLYVVEAFTKCLDSKVEENTILSHDLFESLFARTALVTDIAFLDDYPSHYDTFARRMHRWIRGDWQIAKWVLPSHNNHFSIISRWKIFDNLRRSMVAPALLAWIYLSWIISPAPFASTLVILILLFLPALIHSTSALVRMTPEMTFINHIKNIANDFFTRISQIFLSIVFLPHQAYTSLDAIFRTLYRLFLSKKRMLEWTTASEIESRVLSKEWPSLNLVIPTETFVGFTIISLFIAHPTDAFLVAIPFLLLWTLFPKIAHSISKLKIQTDYTLHPKEMAETRQLARRTWLYFETFVTEVDHWLVPDNFQEDPKPVVAHRTSPTNIGVLLLSTASAYDFGYLGSLELLERLEKTQETLDKLEKYKGHFYNWYDTTNLAPLYPIYISTVDSGNLAAHLITMKNFCLHFAHAPIVEKQLIAGIQDTLLIVNEELTHVSPRYLISPLFAKHHSKNEVQPLLSEIIEKNRDASPKTFFEWLQHSETLKESIDHFTDILKALELEHGEKHFKELIHWSDRVAQMIHGLHFQLSCFAPWSEVQLLNLRQLLVQWLPEEEGQIDDFIKEFKFIFDITQNAKTLTSQYLQKNLNLRHLLQFAQKNSPPDAQLPRELTILFLELENSIQIARFFSEQYLERCANLARRYNDMAINFDFKFLYNKERNIFTIGYNLTEARMDNSYYDLLASEARLGSLFAIAKGDVPMTHWFHLGRQMSFNQGNRALVSWSASMFEYLMPLLVMKNYTNTLLHQTYISVVKTQINYGKSLGLPWGVSESAYNARDLLLFYQYGPFGIPGMGLKYGLGSDIVITPYASALAAMVDTKAALDNFKELKKINAYGRYGFYESIDYTKNRLQKGHRNSIIKSFMVHHQGMILISLNNVIHHNVMQIRFHADPIIKSTELLLQEKIPHHMPIIAQHQEKLETQSTLSESKTSDIRHYPNINTAFPQSNILSNGTYTVMATTVGAGFSLCNDLSVNRWSEDPTLDAKGSFIYLQDHFEESVSSVTFQPLKKDIDSYECNFYEHKIEFIKRDPHIHVHTEIVVSAEDNVELRRVTLTNNSDDVRNVDLTSYMEPVLARAQEDVAHLTFSKLFLETEYISSKHALLIRRRKRSHNDKERWGIHVVITNGSEYSSTEYETDRIRFIGRSRTPANPLVIMENLSLSNTTGTVLDPILSLRKCLTLKPNSITKVCFATGMAENREDALRLIDQYHDIHSFDRENGLAWTKTQADLRHLNIAYSEAQLFQELAGAIIYSNPLMRPISENLQKNQKSQDGLWAHGLSGDLPILTVKVTGERDLPLVKMILRAHEYLRLKKIIVDLVILNNEVTSYRMSLQDELVRQTHLSGAFDRLNKNGGIFLINAGTISDEDKNLFLAFSKVVIDSNKGTLKEQLQRLKSRILVEKLPPAESGTNPFKTKEVNHYITLPKLQFFNGVGGFNQTGDEYVVFLNKDQHTPAPWINVIANQNEFGFIVSETGSGYTWANNSRENRLTPWSNDPVNDAAGEALYLRDEKTQKIWSPTPWPVRSDKPYLIRHGMGYSHFQYNDHGLNHETTYFASLKENIKIIRLKIKNNGHEKRRLSCTYFAEWTLGNNRSQTAQHLVTRKGDQQGLLLAQNPFSNEYHQQIAYCAINGTELSSTSDRKRFLGRNGSYENPAGMRKNLLDNHFGAGLDPCAALRNFFTVNPNEEIEIIILMGQETDNAKINQMVEFHLQPGNLREVFSDVQNYWNKTTQTLQVKTPSPEFDLLFNRWLLYQTLTCRMWARSALYQSGGAYGFRDQLQDSLGLIYSHPEIARAHIIRCAAHQFQEGDVQHWWHPPSNKGVRTRFSDDLLWLPYVVSKYITKTDDWSILEEKANFVEAPLLAEGQEDSYIQPTSTSFDSNIYDHCLRAINQSLKVGDHGLPLMGAGDWNDGMNNIGLKGKGESVWVAWFFAKILKDFAPVCKKFNDQEHANVFLKHADDLVAAIETNAWDGKWYLRAFFDDGTPLGSSTNDECQIDSLTQSWSVLTGLGKPERQTIAMNSVSERLVLKKEKLCVLFTPPFDRGVLKPGYIKGYPPGIRENGGQYSHAAIWSAMAFALRGDSEKAFEVLSYINPINRTNSFSGLQLYKVEPYVLAADIYFGPTHSGRGGWSWYTGSSSLYYQAQLEYVLGMKLEGQQLSFAPCIPKNWKSFELKYQWKSSTYLITVQNPNHLAQTNHVVMALDGQRMTEPKVILMDDGKTHSLVVRMESPT